MSFVVKDVQNDTFHVATVNYLTINTILYSLFHMIYLVGKNVNCHNKLHVVVRSMPNSS